MVVKKEFHIKEESNFLPLPKETCVPKEKFYIIENFKYDFILIKAFLMADVGFSFKKIHNIYFLFLKISTKIYVNGINLLLGRILFHLIKFFGKISKFKI